MIRIVHLSDLHFCTDDIKNKLNNLQNAFSKIKKMNSFNIIPKFSFYDSQKLGILKNQICELSPQPDAICISGDITTFGDEESFNLAKDFFLSLKKDTTKIAFVPGNHDNFSCAWSHLYDYYQKLKYPEKLYLNFRFHFKEFKKCIEDLSSIFKKEHLQAYKEFLKNFAPDQDIILANNKPKFTVSIHPFETVNLNPIWMNMAEQSESEWVNFKKKINFTQEQSDDNIRVVLMHHNPYSSPNSDDHPVVYAYNSAPSASKMLKEFQEKSIKLLLCGHQHSNATYSLDFTLGKKNKIIVCQTNAAGAEGSEASGFNIIDFKTRHAMELQGYIYRAGEYKNIKNEPIFLEPAPVHDDLTLLARSELLHYSFRGIGTQVESNFNKKCDELIIKGNCELIILGQTLKSFSRPAVLNGVIKKKLKSDQKVRFKIMVMDPEALSLHMPKEQVSEEFTDSLRKNFPEHAQASLELLTKFRDSLKKEIGDQAADRFEIYKIPRVIPFGATIHADTKNDEFENGEMFVEILPVGAWEDEAKARLHLYQKSHEALYSFYYNFVLKLLKVSKRND